nr:MAG: wsv294-like protein [Chiromantes dehaani nimavirus]
MTSKVNLTLEIPAAATEIEYDPPPKTPTENSPFPPFPGTTTNAIIDMMEDAPSPFSCPGNDKEIASPINEKTDKKIDDSNGSRTGIRSDVRHAFHYYNNTNKVGEFNHISISRENKLQEIVGFVDHVYDRNNQVRELLDILRQQICDFAKTCENKSATL